MFVNNVPKIIMFMHAGVCLCGGNIPNSDQKCWSRLRLRLGSGRRDYCSLHRSNLLFVFICSFVCCHIFYLISKCSVFRSGRELGKTSPDAPLYIFGATSLIGGHFSSPMTFLVKNCKLWEGCTFLAENSSHSAHSGGHQISESEFVQILYSF